MNYKQQFQGKVIFIVGYFNLLSFYIAKSSNFMTIKIVYKVNIVMFIEYDIVLKEHLLHYDDALQVSNTFDIKFKPVLHDDVMD